MCEEILNFTANNDICLCGSFLWPHTVCVVKIVASFTRYSTKISKNCGGLCFVSNSLRSAKISKIESHLTKISHTRDHQTLLKAKYCPRVAAVSLYHTQKKTPKTM